MSSVASDATNDQSETTVSTVNSNTTIDSSDDDHRSKRSPDSSGETETTKIIISRADEDAAQEDTSAVAKDGDDLAKSPEEPLTEKAVRNTFDAKDAKIETGTLAYQLNTDLSYEILKDSLEHRKTYAQLRLTQGLTYQVLVEDRIKELEMKLADVEKRLAISTTECNETSETVRTDPIPEVVELKDKWRVSTGWFETLEFSFAAMYPAEPHHVIDVLRGPMTKLPFNRKGQPHATKLARRSSHEYDSSTTTPTDGKIERIRINSDLLCDALASITDSGERWISPSTTSIHIRPFKALLSCEKDLRQYAAKLRSQPTGRGSDATFAGIRDGNDLTDMVQTQLKDSGPTQSAMLSHEPTETASRNTLTSNDSDDRHVESLSHVDTLLSLLDTHLAEDLRSYKVFQSGTASEEYSTIAFADLWKLFAPANIIYDSVTAQALQVLAVCGGRRSLRWIPDLNTTSEDSRGANVEAKDSVSPFTIICFSLDFDGEVVGPVQKTINLDPYDGKRDITALSVYPIQYAGFQGSFSVHASDGVDPASKSSYLSVRDHLIERGKLFAKLINPKEVAHRDYHGLTLDKVRVHIDSDVIIDYDLYFQEHPEERPTLGLCQPVTGEPCETQETAFCTCTCSSQTCCENHEISLGLYDDRQVDEYRTEQFIAREGAIFARYRQCQDQLKDEHCILFPNSVPGFVLKTREWCSLDLNKIVPLQSREQSFKDLILPNDYKEMVESLVRMHAVGPVLVEGSKSTSSKKLGNIDQREDLVRGKGKGLIILLHGVPGVGKTSTAECVAEYTKRPLYALTCGDIGESPGEVQKKLSEAFKFAHRWGCVMLLDEADVFLQARDRTDMNRNAVVSVFLRTLEYYSGILFLTTNKVGLFDEAFKSRIHVSLYYKALDPETAKQIWQVNLRRIEETKKQITFSEKKIMKWVEKHQKKLEKKKHRPWNGRQIHNAVQTAVALASFLNSNIMTTDHLNAVASATQEFDDYLKSTHGTDDIGVAQREQARGDDVFHVRYQTPAPVTKAKKKSSKKPEPSSDESSSSSEGSDSDDED